MRKLNGREMKTLFALSIVVPVGLLTTFRLTGILREPPKKERITLEPATLTLSRPNETIAITNRSVQNKWTKEGLSILVGVKIYSYHEKSGDPPYNYHDGLMLQTSVNTSSSLGRINNIKINFHPLDGNAVVFLSEERWDLQAKNATFVALQYWGANQTYAYLEAEVSDSPAGIRDAAYWVFLDEESHELQITIEAVETREMFVRMITIPIRLKILSSGA